MRRILFALIVGLLIADAAGVDALVVREKCVNMATSLPDNTCPSTCVRCACGQPSVTTAITVTVIAQIQIPVVDVRTDAIPSGSPHDILHVPKSTSPTL